MAQGPWFYCLKHHTVEDRDGRAERGLSYDLDRHSLQTVPATDESPSTTGQTNGPIAPATAMAHSVTACSYRG